MPPLFVSSPPANLRPYDKDDGHAGMYAPSGLCGQLTAGAPTGTRTFLARFVPSRNMTITKIAFALTNTGNSADVVDVGIYTFAGTTGTRLGSSGNQTAWNATTGRIVITLSAPVNVTAGTVYYAAIVFTLQGGTTTQVVLLGAGAAQGWTLFGANTPDIDMSWVNAGPPLGTSITSGGQITTAVLMAVLE